MNHKLAELYGASSILMVAKAGRIRWLGHVMRMPDSCPTKKVSDCDLQFDIRRRGAQRTQLLDKVKRALSEIGCLHGQDATVNKRGGELFFVFILCFAKQFHQLDQYYQIFYDVNEITIHQRLVFFLKHMYPIRLVKYGPSAGFRMCRKCLSSEQVVQHICSFPNLCTIVLHSLNIVQLYLDCIDFHFVSRPM